MGIATSRYTGTRGTGYNAINLQGDDAASALLQASIELVNRGARVVVLGCAVSGLFSESFLAPSCRKCDCAGNGSHEAIYRAVYCETHRKVDPGR